MLASNQIKVSFRAALPIVLGYVAIGIPCGILESSIGMDALQVLVLSFVFYSGAGQFMIPNMWLAGSPIAAIIASVSLVNTRQLLYSASLAPYGQGVKRWLGFLFAGTVTDESFGVNIARFEAGDWTMTNATLVNLMSCTSWSVSNAVGVLVGSAIGVPLAVASFAMTLIFICLLVTQKINRASVVAAVVAMVGVYVCKLFGLGGAAILVGAVLGVAAAMLVPQKPGERRTAHGVGDGGGESRNGDGDAGAALDDPGTSGASVGEADATCSR